jgi:hypothetical protein
MTAGTHLPIPHLSSTYQNKIQEFQANNIIKTPFKLVDSSIDTIIREYTRIQPLALASGHGHGRDIIVAPERAFVSVGEWPLNKTVINL